MPPDDDPGATELPEPLAVAPELLEREVPDPELLDLADERAWPVVGLPCAAPWAEPGSMAAIVPVAATLAMTIAAVAAESRRMPRRLSAEGARERPDEWAAIGAFLLSPAVAVVAAAAT